ncbi:MAG: hypothetical protein HYY16_18600 [Planctomycetes bacterium]|nr:hypothetical protein [Planctomycetota bacterium]
MSRVRLKECVPEHEAAVRRWLEGRLTVETVKDNPGRLVQRGAGLYFKEFREKGLAGCLRRTLADRAAREYRILKHLEATGLGAPRPVAYGVDGSRSFVVTREISDVRILKAELAGPSFSPSERRRVLRAFARFVRAVHEVGVRHDDFHIGNVLLGPGPAFHVLDVHRAALGRVGHRERVRMLAFVLHSLITFITKADTVRFLGDYLGRRPERRFVREVEVAFDRERRRYWESREKRCLKDSREFAVEGEWLLRRPMTVEQAQAAVAAPGRVVKELPKRSLRVVGELFVKAHPHARRIWRNARGLEVRDLPTPALRACGRGVVVGDWHADGAPLWDFVKEAFPPWSRGERNDFIFHLACLVRRMHARGVYHHDLKANNVLALPSGGFMIVDLDRVSFGKVSPSRRGHNLAQLNAAVGAPVTRADRLRFYRWYAPFDRHWKRVAREVMRETRARKHVWPARGDGGSDA